MRSMNDRGFAPLILIAIIAAGLIGTTGTVVASNNSKPGDLLYGIDKALEKVQLAMSFTNGMKQNARLSIANERLKELQQLLDEKNINKDAVNKLKDDINSEINKLKDLYKDDSNESLKELEDKAKSTEDKSNQIDKSAESVQKSLESQREDLKKQYEEAVKSGDTTKAQTLMQQINSTESSLKQNEQLRESEKQALEKQREAEKQELEKQKVEVED